MTAPAPNPVPAPTSRPSWRRRWSRWLVWALVLLAGWRFLLWATEGLIDAEAKRRRLEFWAESMLGGPDVALGMADLHLGGLGIARLTLRDVEVEHPNADFIFGDPGRLASPGEAGDERPATGRCFGAAGVVLRLPFGAATGVRTAELDIELRQPYLRIALNGFEESNLSGLWSTPPAPDTVFPLGWPRIGAWRWRATGGVVELARARAGAVVTAQFNGGGVFDPVEGGLTLATDEGLLLTSFGGARWRGQWTIEQLSARLTRDTEYGASLAIDEARIQLRNAPLAAIALFAADWPMDAFPARSTFDGVLERADGGWRLSGRFTGTGLPAAPGLAFPPGAEWRVHWVPETDADGGWRLSGVCVEAGISWSLHRPDHNASAPRLRFQGPPAMAERLRALLDETAPGEETETTPSHQWSDARWRLDPLSGGRPDWWRRPEAKSLWRHPLETLMAAETAARAARIGNNGETRAGRLWPLAWMRRMGTVWDEDGQP